MTIDRGEYPRPHLVRNDAPGAGWLSLCGKWRFRFGDPDCDGPPPADAFDREIEVPFPWESFAAWGRARGRSRDYNEDYLCPEAYLNPADATLEGRRYREAPRQTVGWYRTTVTIPADSKGRRVFLIFGAVDYRAEVWVDGTKVAEHEGGYLPFEADITDRLTPDQPVVISVRAEDPQDHLEQPAGKQIGWYERTSGIWQPVWLEARGECWVDRVRIEPDVDGECARVAVTLGGDAAGANVLLEVLDEEGLLVGSRGLEPAATGGNRGLKPAADAPVPIPSPSLWEPDEPYLYRLRVTVRKGEEVLDTTVTRFGMRTVSVGTLPGSDTRCVLLNGRPIYLRGALAQNFNPFGLYAYPSVAMMREELIEAKSAGFNMIRVHIKIEDPVWLDLADELGVLVMYDMPCFGRLTPLSKARYEAMLRGAIERDSGHPSIFAWVLFNETWGLGHDAYKQDRAAQEWVREMVHLARSLDPTRLVEDNSPCLYDHVETDINSWHFYINDQEKAERHIAEVVQKAYPGSPFNCAPGWTQNDAPLLNSEYGGIDAGMGDRDVSWCFHFLTNALRRHEKVCGYVYTELQDIEWERNGILNYDRTPKEFGYQPHLINGPDLVVLGSALGTTAEPGQRVVVPAFASLFSRDELPAARLGWQVDLTDRLGRTRQAVTEGLREIEAPSYRVTHLGGIEFVLPEEPGLARLVAWLESADGLILSRNWLWREVPSNGDPPGVVPLTDAEWIGFEGVAAEGDLWTGGEGAGEVRYRLRVPPDVGTIKQLTLLAELSAWRPGYKQTDADTRPTDVSVLFAGRPAVVITLPDSPCDARGALSGIRRVPCKYGYKIEVPVKGRALANALASGESLQVTFRVQADASNVGGLMVFSAQAGRYPFAPSAVLGEVAV